MQQLAKEYERDLLASASRRPRHRLARHRLPHITVRQRLGRSLVGLGVKLAEGSLGQTEGERLLRNDPSPQRILHLQRQLERQSLAR
jgi:hypothetical protein